MVQGIFGTRDDGRLRRALRVPGRDRDRDLPRGVRRRHPADPARRTINIRNLAGVPSVVYGLLGLSIFVALFDALDRWAGRTIIAGGLTLAVLVLPIVIITVAEALRAVPELASARPATASAHRAGRSRASSCCRPRRPGS